MSVRLLLILILAGASPSSARGQQVQADSAGVWVRAALGAMGGEAAWRAVGGARVVAHGYRNLLEQSERPEGPFIPAAFSRTERLDFDAGALQQDVTGDAFSFSGTVLADAEAAAFVLSGRPVPARVAQKTEAEERLALGPERILLTALAAPDLRADADTVLQNVPHHVATFAWGGGRVRLLLNARTALPTGVELTRAYPGDVFWGLWGDVTRTTLFSFWGLEPGGLRYPHQWDTTWRGLTASVAVVDTVELGRRPARLAIPDSVRAAFAARAATTIDELPLGVPSRPPVEVAPGIVVIPGAWTVTLVRQPEGVVVLEAPISSGYSARAIEEAGRRFPGVAVMAAVSTSDAWPHVGGVREYVARGVPLFALDLNVPLVERVLAARRVMAPDQLARAPRAADLRPVTSATTVGSGQNRMVIAPVRGEAGERMMLAYFPAHRLLYASDLLQPGFEDSAWLRGYAREVVDAVAREGWDVETVFAMHASPMPWASVVAAVVPEPASDPSAIAEAYQARDFVRVERATRSQASPVALAYRSWALAAVGRRADADAAVAAALRDPALPDTLAAWMLAERVDALARTGDYAAADRAAREALADSRVAADSSRRASVANDARLWAALAETPAASSEGSGETAVVTDAAGLHRATVRVGTTEGSYVLDTGANLSTLTRSEAARLDLTVRDTGVEVGGVTGAQVTAGLAIADSVELAGVRMGPVPFLVLPDSALAFPQIGYAIEGIVGLPVLAALGSVEIPLGGGTLRADRDEHPGTPIGFDGLTIIIRVPVQLPGGARDTAACALDTGAPETAFHASFYQRHRDLLDDAGRRTTVGVAGAGGAEQVSAVVVPSLVVEWDRREVRLSDVPVYVSGETGDCRLGLDAFAGAHALRLDAGRFLLAPVW